MRIIKEVFSNLARNSVLTITSIFTLCVAMLILGVFGLFLMNLDYNKNALDELLEVQIILDTNVDLTMINQINEKLILDEKVDSVKFVSRGEALEEVKEIFGEDLEDLFEVLGTDFLPDIFVVTLNNYDDVGYFVELYRDMPIVEDVSYHSESFELTASFTRWIQSVSAILALILCALAVLLVSNTVRLAMASRKDEVIIMRYIGATRGRIELPFLLEGIFIGISGAVITFVITYFGYLKMFNWFSLTGQDELFLSSLKLVPLSSSMMLIGFIYLVFGMILGALGSGLAISKHLKA